MPQKTIPVNHFRSRERRKWRFRESNFKNFPGVPVSDPLEVCAFGTHVGAYMALTSACFTYESGILNVIKNAALYNCL